METAAAEKAAADTRAGDKSPPASAKLQRKIVYTAEVELVVEQFDKLPARVEELVKRFEGYVARSNLRGQSGNPRGGQWTLRVPVESYQEFLSAAKTLGEVRRVSSNSQDVSEEFYDIEARVRNKKQEEARLLEHLKISTAKLDDILTVEREIARVRGEIEQMEGRLRVLTDLSSLTTVNLTVEEIKDYVPQENPTYAVRLARAWGGSLSSLGEAGEDLSIATAAALPWIVVFVIPVLAIGMVGRSRWRRRQATKSV